MIPDAICVLVDGVQHSFLAPPQADAGELLGIGQQLKEQGHACTGLHIHQCYHRLQPAQHSTPAVAGEASTQIALY